MTMTNKHARELKGFVLIPTSMHFKDTTPSTSQVGMVSVAVFKPQPVLHLKPKR